MKITSQTPVDEQEHNACHKIEETKNYLDYQNYMLVQKSVSKTIQDAKRKLEKIIAKNVKNNPRQFYSYLSKNTKSRSHVSPLIDSG